VAAVVVMVVALGVAYGWFIWLPSYRPSLKAGEQIGIDVSHHQGQIDWTKVAKDRITFAYVKATEGGDSVDTEFTRNWANGRAAGLKVGAYHFFTLCRSGADQAANVIRNVPVDVTALPIAVDLELAGNCRRRPTGADLRKELDDFLATVETHYGVKAVLYVGPEFEAKYPVKASADRPLWYVSFVRRPSRDDWTIWQLHGFASVDGIKGSVDLDVARGLLGSSAR
jgi:lysozyme